MYDEIVRILETCVTGVTPRMLILAPQRALVAGMQKKIAERIAELPQAVQYAIAGTGAAPVHYKKASPEDWRASSLIVCSESLTRVVVDRASRGVKLDYIFFDEMEGIIRQLVSLSGVETLKKMVSLAISRTPCAASSAHTSASLTVAAVHSSVQGQLCGEPSTAPRARRRTRRRRRRGTPRWRRA